MDIRTSLLSYRIDRVRRKGDAAHRRFIKSELGSQDGAEAQNEYHKHSNRIAELQGKVDQERWRKYNAKHPKEGRKRHAENYAKSMATLKRYEGTPYYAQQLAAHKDFMQNHYVSDEGAEKRGWK